MFPLGTGKSPSGRSRDPQFHAPPPRHSLSRGQAQRSTFGPHCKVTHVPLKSGSPPNAFQRFLGARPIFAT